MRETVTITSKGESLKKALRSANKSSSAIEAKGKAKKEFFEIMAAMASDYRLNKGKFSPVTLAPAAIGRTVTSKAPKTRSSGPGSVCISHRELIEGSILGYTAFTVAASYNLQPGSNKTFPWLSIQAAQYEQYRFRKLQFIYVPIVGTSVAGDVMMLADYNVSDPPPLVETDALDHPGAKTGSLWETHIFKCDISKMHALGPRKFIRTAAVAGDQKTFDCGNFHLCVNNSGITTSIGKLFVEYEVEFYVPQINPRSELKPQMTSIFERTVIDTLVDNVFTDTKFEYKSSNDPLRIVPMGTAEGTVITQFLPPAGCYRVFVTVVLSNATIESTDFIIQLAKNGAGYPTGSSFVEVQNASTKETLTITNVVPITAGDALKVYSYMNTLAGTPSTMYKSIVFTLA